MHVVRVLLAEGGEEYFFGDTEGEMERAAILLADAVSDDQKNKKSGYRRSPGEFFYIDVIPVNGTDFVARPRHLFNGYDWDGDIGRKIVVVCESGNEQLRHALEQAWRTKGARARKRRKMSPTK